MHCKQVGPKYGASPKTIRNIWCKRSWKHATKHLWTPKNIQLIPKVTLAQPAASTNDFRCGTLIVHDTGFRAKANGGPVSHTTGSIHQQLQTLHEGNGTPCGSWNYPLHGSPDLPLIFLYPAVLGTATHPIPATEPRSFPSSLHALSCSALAFQPLVLSPRPSTPPPWLYPQRQGPAAANIMAMILSSLLNPAHSAAAFSPSPPSVLLPLARGTGFDPQHP